MLQHALLFLQVGQHTLYTLDVRGVNKTGLTKVAFAFSGFFGQDMGSKSLAAANFAGAGGLEPLSSSPVGFHLGHDSLSFYRILLP